MAKVVLYKTQFCGYCGAAIRFLSEVKNQEVEVIDLTGRHEERMALVQKTRHRTVPQIFINDQFIGGYDEMRALDREGKLDALLAEDTTDSQ